MNRRRFSAGRLGSVAVLVAASVVTGPLAGSAHAQISPHRPAADLRAQVGKVWGARTGFRRGAERGWPARHGWRYPRLSVRRRRRRAREG